MKVHYTNNDLGIGVSVLARKMALDDFKPEVIVGVLRGGIIPAVYLSHWYECKLYSVAWSTRDGMVGNEVNEEIISAIIEDKKVLVVDDICDSGLTLQQLYERINNTVYIKSLMADGVMDNVKTAVLHYNIGQDVFDPDYFHIEINKLEDPSWIVYPWES